MPVGSCSYSDVNSDANRSRGRDRRVLEHSSGCANVVPPSRAQWTGGEYDQEELVREVVKFCLSNDQLKSQSCSVPRLAGGPAAPALFHPAIR